MPYPHNRLSQEEHRIRSKQITLNLLRSGTYQTCQSIHLYESLPDEVDTQYILHHAQKSSRDIYHPTKDPLDNQKCDLVIVPGRKFDKQMTREGRGQGYYDRFLHHIPSLRIGLCYEMQLFERIERKWCDIPMDLVITEKGIYNRRTLITFEEGGWST